MNIFNWKWQTSWYHDTNTHNYDIVKHPRFPKINFQKVSKLGQFGLTATFGSKPFQQILGWRVWFSTFDLKSNQCKWSRKCETVFFHIVISWSVPTQFPKEVFLSNWRKRPRQRSEAWSDKGSSWEWKLVWQGWSTLFTQCNVHLT